MAVVYKFKKITSIHYDYNKNKDLKIARLCNFIKFKCFVAAYSKFNPALALKAASLLQILHIERDFASLEEILNVLKNIS